MEAKRLEQVWMGDPRWRGIERPYTGSDVVRLRGTVQIEHTLAKLGARRLWERLQNYNNEGPIRALGALTGNQAVQQVQAGLEAIYMSGWQVAADANVAGETYPDQSLYPANSVPTLVRRINAALQRADQIDVANGNPRDWFMPIVADAEAGFGGNLNSFELMKSMIDAGAAGVHFEDQLASAKKCGHLGGKVLVPTQEFINKLIAARLAADVCGVDTVLIARTDADSAKLLTSDIDYKNDGRFFEVDKLGEIVSRTPEGFFHITGGQEMAIARGLAYAPYADLIWCETSHPDLHEARKFAEAIHAVYPDKLLAYNCSPSFNWRANLSDETIKKFQTELGEMGYMFQFVTLAGFHNLNLGMYELASAYREEEMWAYSEMQQREFARQKEGFTAVKHQQFVGTGYFDAVAQTVMGGQSSTTALSGSTEEEQFE